MVAKKIRGMKDNKSPGVDGIPPKLLLEIVEQISKSLAKQCSICHYRGPRGSSSVRMENSKHKQIVRATSQRTIHQ